MHKKSPASKHKEPTNKNPAPKKTYPDKVKKKIPDVFSPREAQIHNITLVKRRNNYHKHGFLWIKKPHLSTKHKQILSFII